MDSDQQSFSLIVFAPPRAHREDARPLSIVHAIERTIPGLKLRWTTSETVELIALPDRDAWVVAHSMDGGLPFLCNEDDDNLVTLFGLENPYGPGHRTQFEVHIRLPLNPQVTASAPDVLAAVAEAANASWGDLTPFRAAADIAEQSAPTLAGPPSPPHGLPALPHPDSFAPETPHRLGWLNYWSAATARTIGFPDASRDTELLSRARRTGSNGWVVPVTDAPLDLDLHDHLSAILRTYERFPIIGGRAAP
jgi:hypothetical protein